MTANRFWPLRPLIFWLVTGGIAVGHAQTQTWRSSPELGLGFTSNANFASSEPTSDTYAMLTGRLERRTTSHSWLTRLNFWDYATQSANDRLSWRTSPQWHLSPSHSFDRTFSLAVGGQHFTNGAPGFTEVSFDFLYGEASLEFSSWISEKTSFRLMPLFQYRSFLNFDGRKDFLLSLEAGSDFEITRTHELSPFLNVGFAPSSDPLYSRRSLDIGVTWTWDLSQRTQLISSLIRRVTSFPNRLVTDSTAISVGRRRLLSGSRSEREQQELTSLDVGLDWHEGPHSLRLTLNSSVQTTKSQIEDFKEFGIIGSYAFQF
jgi:hypothetical protein